MSISLGQKNWQRAKEILGNVLLLLLAIAAVVTTVLLPLRRPILYVLADGLTAMGKVRYAFPLSVFRKLIYMACIFALPRLLDIQFIFYARSISDAIGAAFSLLLFAHFINPNLKKITERGKNHE